MPDFEAFSRGLLALKREPVVTILRRGVLSLNRSAYIAMGSPAAVELLYDAEARIIGLRQIDVHADAAQYVRTTGSSGSGSFLISAMAFTNFYNIDVSTSRRWLAHLEDGALSVNLDGPSAEIAANRSDGRRFLHTHNGADGRVFGQA